ncbi:membrane protein [Pedobacter lusitanus]|uniref:Membrane protein n=1 Tax=Pedobacter lusitanus TaxID=1503925 RepID=A0A0D0GHZ7_9SPHI|nr:DUF5686 and carboxypeptidase-like regulatory domain-containing protein [Pedobacter lusitanus]KIO76852.1 membrane protein [Pedobacter lusitanus]
MIDFQKKSFCVLTVLIFLFTLQAAAQSTEISGVITNIKDRTPIPYVTVLFKGSKIVTKTDANGKYTISTTEGYSQLQVEYVGFKTRYLPIIPGKVQVLNIKLQEESQNLNEVNISSNKKAPYRNKDNPAVELIRKVIEHKPMNRLESAKNVEYQQYDWMQFSLSNLSEKFKNKKIFRKYQFLFDQQDSSEIGGKNIMPIYLRERLSKNYYRKDPEKTKVIILADKHVNFDQGLVDNNAIGNYFERMYADVNIYDNNIIFTNSQFLSPIADGAPAFYKFFITDTIKTSKPALIELSFVPRNKNALLFEGKIYITMDGRYAVQNALLKTGKGVNINFIRALEVKLNFEQDSLGKFHLSKSHLLMDFGVGADGGRGFKGERTVIIKDYKTNVVQPDILYKGESMVVDPQAENRSDQFWAQNRLDTLANEKVKIYHNMDSLGKMKSFKRMMDVASFLFIGYKKYGPVEVGPIYTFYSFNSLEGFRLRFGGRTTTDFSKRFYFDTYAAYGFKDERWKGYLSGAYAFNNKSIYTFPQSFIRASFQRDVDIPGDGAKNIIPEDNFVSSFKRGESNQFLYSDYYRVQYMQEYSNHFSFNLGFKKWTQTAAGSLVFDSYKDNQIVRTDRVTSSELSLDLRYAPHERFYQGKTFRERLIEKYPVFNLNYAVGVKGLFSGQYNYQNIMGTIDKRFYLSQFGRSDLRLEGGYIVGKVPFPLLDIHRANQSYSYQTYAYNLMNFMEFVSDHYVSLNIDHNFNGLILNRIPLIKKLKLREYITFKGLYGGLRKENDPNQDPALLQFPVNGDGVKTTYSLGKLPYIEGSVGIGNIFKVVRLDLVRRFNYLQNPGISKYGVRARVQFEF